jgi:hypothetical protein
MELRLYDRLTHITAVRVLEKRRAGLGREFAFLRIRKSCPST